jgi:hypothetical protein
LGAAATLPEAAAVAWRRRVDERALVVRGRTWTTSTVLQSVPFVAAAGGLLALEPLSAPVAAMALVKAWLIPALYAQRGANVARPRWRAAAAPSAAAERRALGLLGDLVGHEARATFAETGLVPERGRFGVWLVGERGALLVRPGGRRVHCYCIGVPDPDLPAADRAAHLLLALREDEAGFATVANLAFSGAPWRVRARLDRRQRPALDAAGRAVRRPT